ncbi:exosome non-catalytic core subunit rrp40 [Microbotryomycetes sp. JL221]|nr:exosome non-catalytic core subunit rrp40 [Microbotryomycetes sp. JL221]
MTTLLLPGDPLPSTSRSSGESSSAARLHIGPGLQQQQKPVSITHDSTKVKGKEKLQDHNQTDLDHVHATRAGLLGHDQDAKAERFWIESEMRRYVPHPPEPVIGIIVARHAEGFRVDIGSSQAASLDALAFEGATKRNKPNLKVGSVVYAHLLATPPFSEPEISCVDSTTQKASGFGELTGGFVIRGVELNRCRSLLAPKNPILPKLGSKCPFEVAVGMNGRVWIKTGEGDEEHLIDMIHEIRGR